jgi:cell division protein FtsI/penicillin-binding protein 2
MPLLLAATLLCGAQAAQQNSLAATMNAAVSESPAVTGAIIVQDVVSGSILAARGLDVAAHRLDRPGSTLKPFVLMALLDSGRLDPRQRILCRRTLTIGRTRMDCTHPADVTQIDAEAAIAWSCNTYVSEAATRLSAHELVQAFRRAGFDSPTGRAPNEAIGTVPLPGNREELQLEALGSWGIEVTPLELLEAYRKLALRRRDGSTGADAPVFAGLADSVAFGMAHAAFVADMSVAGKTGTASSKDSARSHGFFVGYAPAEKPEMVVLVYLENGRGMDAAAVAEPIFSAYAKFKKP